jgi:two-component system LytT family sensor kinase
LRDRGTPRSRCFFHEVPGYSGRVEITRASSHRPWRWALYVALWLLLCSIFGSQLYLAGYVTPWPRAVAAEAVYWLAWWLLVPVVFWWCRRLRATAAWVRVAGLMGGALLASLVVPLIAQSIGHVLVSLRLCIGPCEPVPPLLSTAGLMQAVRTAGVNLPVYTGFVLAWHALAFYREARDRQVRAAQLESLLHQAQLEALRSQLNPHFLFNSLHSIAELVHEDPKLAEQLIVRLGELLRRALETSKNPELPLEQELDFIRGYLQIEQMRLGPRLRVDWDIAPEALPWRVPSLILQPLVENAIQHGIAAVSTPGTLSIRARLAAGFLEVEIGDSGPGLAPPGGTRSQGIGIANTRARLQALYGGRQAFELRQGEGLVVSLRVPAARA